MSLNQLMSAAFWILALRLTLPCQAQHKSTLNILYVKLKANDYCPETPCLTLTQYADNQEKYFYKNTQLQFLPGNHDLQENITIEGSTNITLFALVGSKLEQSRIVSNGQVAFHLIGVQTTQVNSIHFFGSNNLIITNSTCLVTSDIHFTPINGHGFVFENINNISATDTTVSNSSNVSSAGIVSWSNGVFINISVLNNSGDSVIAIEWSNIHFKRACVFLQNNAKKSSTLKIVASTIFFDNFTQFHLNGCKKSGGAMSIINSAVTSTSQIELTSNFARNGGAIELKNSALVLKGTINVVNNSAIFSLIGVKFAGAIHSIGSNITMEGRINFDNNRVLDTFAQTSGGAIMLQNTSMIMTGDISFLNNQAKSLISYGGAIHLSNSTLIATSVNLTFTNNYAKSGGAIALTNSLNIGQPHLLNTVIVEGECLFDSNEAESSAGALYGDGDIELEFNGYTTFTKNRGDPLASQILIHQSSRASLKFIGHTEIKHSYSKGVTVSLQNNVKAVFSGINRFINNSGHGGVLRAYNSASFLFLGHSYFFNNFGGTVIVHYSMQSNPSLIMHGTTYFVDNDSGISLQSSYVYLEGLFLFERNRDGRGCINLVNSNMTVNGTVKMNANTAIIGPGINSFQSIIYMVVDHCNFSKNVAQDDGGTIFAQESSIHMYVDNCTFTSNVANRGGAIYAVNSNIFFSGHQTFENNKATSGGAIALGLYSVIHFNDLKVEYVNNTADKGAILYVDDILGSVDCIGDSKLSAFGTLSIRSLCFFSIPQNSMVTQSGNVAYNGGNVLYGGHLKRCKRDNADKMFMSLFQTDNKVINITSDPYEVVFCKQDAIVHYSKVLFTDAIPGKRFSISIVGINQLLQPVFSTIRAETPSESNFTARLGRFESKQSMNNSCSDLKYHIFTPAPAINLTLFAEGPCNTLGTASITVSIKLGSCPDGFELVKDECICSSELLKYTSVCNVDDESIQNDGDFWAAGVYENGSYNGIVSFPHCPFDYCRKDTVEFTLNDPDIQCTPNRSGIICGQCKLNYSLTFGEGRCSICSSKGVTTVGFILLFALLGIVLVVLLIVLKMTVVSGTLNGLIFYANIIDASRDIFIPQGSWLRTFISWLNLDFGFSVCFYDGMDFYAYTWMQFLFPFYIWMLIGAVIIITRYSVWMTKRVGSNPVAVLATLILLSYAKLLRTIITVFYFAIIQLPDEKTSTVWLYDGNVSFLRGKHLALFIFALIFFLFVFLPYNLLLTFVPWLQKLPSEKHNESRPKAMVRKVLLGWLSDFKFKMLLDAYTIPYNEGYRFWTGIFLMLRCLLLLVFASNVYRHSSTAILAIATVTLAVTFFSRAFTGRIYKDWYVDILEATFLLNLGVLSAATFHIRLTGGNQETVANALIGISFVLFLGIVGYHTFIQVENTNLFKTFYKRVKSMTCKCFRSHAEPQSPTSLTNTAEEFAPLTTYISVPGI